MLEGSNPFRYKNETCENILVPSQEYLCYMKVLSFLGRDSQNKEKIEKDLNDIKCLCDKNDFRLDKFLNLIRRYNLEGIISEHFHNRIKLVNGCLDDCNFGIITKLFSTCIDLKKSTESKNSQKRLIAFDVDGTLVKGIRHSWTLLWKELGLNNKIQAERKRKFINGEISYLDWVKMDTKDLIDNGFEYQHVVNIIENKRCSLTQHLTEAINLLKDNGFVVTIISGGVDVIFYELLPNAKELFDEILINQFIFDENGKLEKISATEYDWDDSKKGVVGKNRGLERLCEKYSVPIENSVFVGDDLNDFKAMKTAGKKIYYCAENREFKDAELPKGIILIPKNDLMDVANTILKREENEML